MPMLLVPKYMPILVTPTAFSRNVVRYYSFYEKYAAKLADKAKAQGLSVEELLKEAKPQVENQNIKDAAVLMKQIPNFRKNKSLMSKTEVNSKTAAPSKENSVKNFKTKPDFMELDSFINTSKFYLHDTKEVEMLWKARFVNSPLAFAGSMNSLAFSKLYINAKKYPRFVLPLPHSAHGVELHYIQWLFATSETIYCLLTSLAQYKLHNEYAQPHTTFLLHTKFAADKDIVLTNGLLQENGLSIENSALLTLNLQRFYTASSDSPSGTAKLELLKAFTNGDPNFSVDALITATETLD